LRSTAENSFGNNLRVSGSNPILTEIALIWICVLDLSDSCNLTSGIYTYFPTTLTVALIRFILMAMENQLSLFPETPTSFTVQEVNAYLRELMESDRTLQDIWVQGEISNLSVPRSGHMYFTLKDAQATLRCVMWRSQVARLTTLPQDGDQAEIHGGISVYEAGGQYQLYADQIRPIGEGLLYQEFNRLKQKLQDEGLFDPERKRPVPYSPKTIGIVTSPTGAALRDILNTLRRRYPLVEVVLSPTTVQGDAAPDEIIGALKRLNQTVQPDVILVARGGGSIEDLWAFNEEQVARAIAASNAPVICGVGHETDFTIADFVADLRAPTPTAAAEQAVPDQMEIHGILLDLQQLHATLLRRSPDAQLRSNRQRVDDLIRQGERAMRHQIEIQRTQLQGFSQYISALNPQGILERGYAVVTQPDGRVVKKLKDVKAGDQLQVRVSDGIFDAEAKKK
jgi:exodeoxyribonuclease VII large subunit